MPTGPDVERGDARAEILAQDVEPRPREAAAEHVEEGDGADGAPIRSEPAARGKGLRRQQGLDRRRRRRPVRLVDEDEERLVRARLDLLMDVFGEDRILFGSDWPNSDGVAPVERIFAVAKEYFAAQPRTVAEKYFWRNSVAVYKWVKRDPSQPS